MSVTFNTFANSTVPLEDHLQILHERDQLRKERDALLEKEWPIVAVLSDDALQPAARIVAIFTTFAMENERSRGHVINLEAPVCFEAVAAQAGVSDDTAGKAIDRLGKFGAWSKKPSRAQCDEETGHYATPLVLREAGSVAANPKTVARLRPTPEERKALTGRGKPGSQPGEKREKVIKASCPHCGSERTSLRCPDCGHNFPTDDLQDESARSSPRDVAVDADLGAMQVAVIHPPQVAGHKEVYSPSASSGCPPAPRGGGLNHPPGECWP